MERWVKIEGYEEFYEISTKGRVKSLRQNKVMMPGLGSRGYMLINLRKDGNHTPYDIHRLVAKAFILNPEGKKTVNHIDACKTNNSIENLEWMTQKENSMHASYLGLFKPHRKNVSQKSLHGEIIEVFKSMLEAQKNTGVDQASITKCCQGKRRTAGGYLWEVAYDVN